MQCRVLLAALFVVACIAATEPAWAQTQIESGNFETSDGVQLHYLEAGSGPLLVFVPGWTMPAEIWGRQIRHFATTHHVVALDPRGHGRSEKPAHGYYPSRRGQDIGELLEHLGGEPAVVVAWSLGVQETLVYTEEHGTGNVRALALARTSHQLTTAADDASYPNVFSHQGVLNVLQSTPARPLVRKPARPRRLVALVTKPGEKYELVDWDIVDDEPQYFTSRFISLQVEREDWTREFVRMIFRNPPSEGYLEEIAQAALSVPTNATAIMIANIILMGPNDLSSVVDTVDRPVLFVYSSLSWAVEAADEVRLLWPESRVEVIDETSHALFVDQPERFNRVLEEFIASLPER